MEAIGAASAILGLAIPVFQCAKALRDRIKLVRYPLYLFTICVCLDRSFSLVCLSVLAGRI